MSLDALLLHMAQVQRATETLDPYGNAARSWYDVDSVPARLVIKQQWIWSNERAESVAVTHYLLLLPTSADVAERDREVVDSVTFDVTAVLPRNAGRTGHHKSLTLEVVR